MALSSLPRISEAAQEVINRNDEQIKEDVIDISNAVIEMVLNDPLNSNLMVKKLFLDWNMPKLDGRQCLLLIRSLPQYTTVPVVIYSTAKDTRLEDEALLLGATHYMLKPTSMSDLVIKLEAYFRSHKAELNAKL